MESQDLKSLALQLTSDPEHKFELAIQLKQLALAREVLLLSESEPKWRQLGDLALVDFDLRLAEECFLHAEDWSSLLLLHSSSGSAVGMSILAERAAAAGRFNVAFVAYFLLQRVDECLRLLCETNRVPEAAFLARTYSPRLVLFKSWLFLIIFCFAVFFLSSIPRVLEHWRENLKKVSERASQSLADSVDFPELFSDLPAVSRLV